ncbi:CD99 antigen isoform X2 [Microcaecilia unicolor]|uniref:CD99 antigen-like isoform X2 n=1 Tax=Microcaecilia unicolor TaxID=1415580 RepID=A0A6P7XYD1_9AMPH|nr:CD99 antigen-like isoform X2 [Microcaecilia unicolor]
MLSLRLACFVCLAFAVSEITGQDYFDLGDALDDPVPTKKPVPTRKPNADGDLHLEDAFGEEMKTPAPKPKPGGGGGAGAGGSFGDDDLAVAAGGHPNQPSGGNIGDDDLYNIAGGHKPNNPGGSDDPGKSSEDMKPNQIGGIVGGIGAILVAAIGSFIAYQKKKFCFKEGDSSASNLLSQLINFRGQQHASPGGTQGQQVDPKREVLDERWRRVTSGADY